MTTLVDGEGAVLQGTTIATFKSGVATFAGMTAPTISGGGTFMLTATEIGINNPVLPEITKKFVIEPYALHFDTEISGYLAQRQEQILDGSGSAGLLQFDLIVETSHGKQVAATAELYKELPHLVFTLIPVSSGAAVDPALANLQGNLHISVIENAPGEVAVEHFPLQGVSLPFEFPGSYRVHFDTATAFYPDEPDYPPSQRSTAALSAIKAFTTPLLKVYDPVINVVTTARLVAVGDTFTVAAHLWVSEPVLATSKSYLGTQAYTGIRFELLGMGSVEAYTQPLPYRGNASLSLTIQKPGRYRLILSVVYTPGEPSVPFNSLNFVPADGLLPVTIPITVIK